MALYRIVNNYYTDILDTINDAYIKNGKNFEKAWDTIDKLHIVKKLSQLMHNLENIQETDKRYWKAQKKVNIFYIIILTFVLVAIVAVFGVFGFLKYKEFKAEKIKLNDLISIYVKYCIYFIICFAVFFVVMLNMGYSIKRANAQLIKNETDFNRFYGLLFNTSQGTLIKDSLVYFGNIINQNLEKAKYDLSRITAQIKEIKNELEKEDGVATIDVDTLTKFKNYLSQINNVTFNQVIGFPEIMNEIRDSLKVFYDEGRGYYNLKLHVVSSSNVYTLREIKRIMNFYYFLTVKRSVDTKESQKNINSILEKLLITPVKNITIQKLMQEKSIFIQFMDTVSQMLVPYELNMSKHSAKIIEKLTTDNMSAEESTWLSDVFIPRLMKSIFIKQKTSLRNIVGNNPNKNNKYYTPDEFLGNIDDMTYLDLREGLELDYLRDLIYLFYQRITVAKGSNNMDDLSFEARKTKDLLMQSMGMIIAVVVTIFVYYASGWYNDYKVIERRHEREVLQLKLKYGLIDSINASPSEQQTGGEEVKEKFKDVLQTLKDMQWKETFNIYMRLILPLTFAIFVISLVASSAVKKDSIYRYNEEIIETNTSEFKGTIDNLYSVLTLIEEQMSAKTTTKETAQALFTGIITQTLNKANIPYDKTKLPKLPVLDTDKAASRIGDIEEISDDMKFMLFSRVKYMIDKFENCNYIVEAANNKFPFPYSELTVDVFLLFAIFAGIAYMTKSFKPLDKYSQIKEWKQKLEDLEDGLVQPTQAEADKIHREALCHENDMESIMFSLKIMFFVFVVLFMLFYSSKLVSTASDFDRGIYNSGYFEKTKCYRK